MHTKIIKTVSILLILALFLTFAPQIESYAAAPSVAVDSQTAIFAIADVEKKPMTIDNVPLFNQKDYSDIPYGKYGTISSHGCGIVCLAMVATYLTDTVYSPIDLAKRFGSYNTEHGSYWSLFEGSDDVLGIDVIKETSTWASAKSALKNGQIVISAQTEGLFTTSGHFIVLAGINENGKIMVNDPNGWNWERNEELIDGFANGFTEDQISENCVQYWIYAPKNRN